MGGDVDQIRVDREVGETTAVGEERLARVAVGLVLPDRILDGLAGERILELGGEDGNAVQEQNQVEALFVLDAVPDLPGDREEVRPVEPPRLLVEPARRAEVREPEPAAHVLETPPEDLERAPPLDLGRKALQEPLPHLGAVVLREPLPLLRLGGLHEVEDVTGKKAERAVVVLRPAPTVATRPHVRVAVGRRRFGDGTRNGRDLVRSVAKQRRLDRVLECALGDRDAHRSVPRFSPGMEPFLPEA